MSSTACAGNVVSTIASVNASGVTPSTYLLGGPQVAATHGISPRSERDQAPQELGDFVKRLRDINTDCNCLHYQDDNEVVQAGHYYSPR